jgi:HD-GYP domain-containing protein (c-di-GMP phosphodiesterase class II)
MAAIGRLEADAALSGPGPPGGDSYDAMISTGLSGAARRSRLGELSTKKGRQFDPQVVEAFLVVLEREKSESIG